MKKLRTHRAVSGGGILGEVLIHPLDLARLVDAWPRQAGRLPRKLHSVEWLEIIEPHRLGVVLGEENLADPFLVAALQETQDERGLAHDLLHARHFDLARSARHRRATRRAAEPGRRTDRIGIKLLRSHQWHIEERLRARVARDEHVVRHDAQAHLLSPLVGPHLGVVVDAAHHRGLRADHNPGVILEPLDRLTHRVRLQLTYVTEVAHDRNVAAAHLLDLPQQLVQLVCVVVGGEALRPESESACADTQILDVGEELRVLEGLEVLLDEACLHEHGVSAGEENVGHLRVLVEVCEERAGVLLGEAQVGIADELRPSEAVRAVGVAGLAGSREEKHRL
mmetsp:Transcript_17172/g.34860  ORF Transcript_17172/g.34860 Transcript_17172/m.34860 type:complete len:338 (-) Transcript_17172:604-1617(-)